MTAYPHAAACMHTQTLFPNTSRVAHFQGCWEEQVEPYLSEVSPGVWQGACKPVVGERPVTELYKTLQH